MSVRTDVNPKFLLRMGILGLVCLGGGGWFLYDGLVGYPNQTKWATEYVKFAEENEELGAKDLYDKWKEHATEQGWPTWSSHKNKEGREKTPYGSPKTDFEITEQYYYAGGAALIGLIFLGRLFLWLGCWIEADDHELRSSGGQQVRFDQISALDKKKWPKKGIAYVRYKKEGGQKKLVLDDCNYDRDTTQTILRMVEEKIGPDKIVNGKPEPPLKPPPEDATPSGETDPTVKSVPQ